ncbi:MAG: VOC family protein [Promicromonosporaceae bacterium]|nr:VOC family protein [Promicromonosporaceae bacterium]
MLLNHVEIQVSDFEASAKFYDAIFATVGAVRQEDMTPNAIGWGNPQGGPEFWIGQHRFGEGFRESHLAFSAPSREAVDAFVAAAEAQGMEVLHAPRLYPEYQGGPLVAYYAGFVRDPDGNNVEAAHLEFDFAQA